MMMIMAVVVLVMTIRMTMMTMMHSEAGWTIQQTQGFSIYRGLGPHVNSYSQHRYNFHHHRHIHQHQFTILKWIKKHPFVGANICYFDKLLVKRGS